MTDFLENLPNALSAEERELLEFWARDSDLVTPGTSEFYRGTAIRRALALIDALTAHLAEAVARMTVAEQRVAEWEDGRAVFVQAARLSEFSAALARAEAAELNVKRVTAERVTIETGWRRAESEAAALRAELNDWRRIAAVQSDKLQNELEISAALRAECSGYRDANEMLTEDRSALRAENERLRASYERTIQAEYGKREALDEQLAVMLAERDAALARAEAAESHNEQHERMWRDEVARCDRAESEAAALRAEVERLKAEEVRWADAVARLKGQYEDRVEMVSDLHDQLAAANALADLWEQQASEYPPEEAMGAAAVRLCARELRAHLARYPAAQEVDR